MTQPKKQSESKDAEAKTTDAEEGANPPTDSIEEATEAGYLGAPPDQTPNEDYTVEGVNTTADPKEGD